jgi:predicted DNA-binding transcriptional regulator AlpA
MQAKQYITRKKLLARFGGISAMTLWRWERDEKLGFPRPTEINGRKYYDLAEVEAWERERALASSAKVA